MKWDKLRDHVNKINKNQKNKFGNYETYN